MHEIEVFVPQGSASAQIPQDTGVFNLGKAHCCQGVFCIHRGDHLEEPVPFVGIFGIAPAFDALRREVVVVLGRIVQAIEKVFHVVEGDAQADTVGLGHGGARTGDGFRRIRSGEGGPVCQARNPMIKAG